MKLFGKLAVVLAFTAAPLFADSTTQFAFTTNLGDIGSSDTVSMNGFGLTIQGYVGLQMFGDLWEKNQGPTETGIGLAAGVQREISGNNFIQMDMSKVLVFEPQSVVLTINSIQGADAYTVWGSNLKGILGTVIAANQTSPTFTIPDLGKYDFISITDQSGSVLIEDVDVNVSEPSTLLLLGIGLVGLLLAGRKFSG